MTLHWMDELRLRKVIEMPAERAGLTYDDGLVDRIIRDARGPHARGDAGSAPGALPLVAHLLETLYTQRRGRTLTTRAYNAAGGVAGALAHGADAIIPVLGDEDRGAPSMQTVPQAVAAPRAARICDARHTK